MGHLIYSNLIGGNAYFKQTFGRIVARDRNIINMNKGKTSKPAVFATKKAKFSLNRIAVQLTANATIYERLQKWERRNLINPYK